MEHPLVTIGITTYNSNISYLSTALDSAINQEYQNIEIIISDDASQNIDEIENLIRVKNDKRIIFLKSLKNKGVSDSLNNIVSYAKGHYFTWCPDDDYMHVSKVKLQVESLKSNPNAISVCDHCQILDFLKIKRNIKHKFYLNFLNSRLYLILLDRINGASLMIPTNALKNKKFDISLKHIQDYDMWIRLFDDLEHVFISKTLFYSRQHTQQSSNKNDIEAKREISKFYLEYFKLNMHNLIYYDGVKIYLYIIIFFQFRDIKSVVSYCMDKDNYKRYVVNLFYKSNIIYYIGGALRITGILLVFIRDIKNFLMYKFIFKLLR